MVMATYNGFPNYNQWNVSLYLSNERAWYDMGQECVKAMLLRRQTIAESITYMLCHLPSQTPDRVRFTRVGVHRWLTSEVYEARLYRSQQK